MHLTSAHNQWAERPADQRFWNLDEMFAATMKHREAAAEAIVANADLRVEAADGDLQLVGRTGVPARLTSWAFRQLAAKAEAPAGYLSGLPATLAAQNLNHGLKTKMRDQASDTALLLHRNGGFYARAILTEKYTRVWNEQILRRLVDLQEAGWVVPPARPVGEEDGNTRIATAADEAVSLTVKAGDRIGPAGLYASFEDMFAFMIHPDRIIDDGSEGGLMRGFFAWNSEVGKSTFGVTKFLFRGVCGNHIVWDAEDVSEIRVRHIGNADERAFGQLQVELKKYANESANEDQARVTKARTFRLGTSTQSVVDLIFGKHILARKTAQAALEAVRPDVDGDPLTAWGYAQGITRLSQNEKNADKRVDLDRAAGKVLRIAF